MELTHIIRMKNNILHKGSMRGLYVPLITPMHKNIYDDASMGKLIKSINDHVDGYVPGLSTGEGDKLSNALWKELIKSVRSHTEKIVIAGIKSTNINTIIYRAQFAQEIGCNGIIIPLISSSYDENYEYLSSLTKNIYLPIVIYNTPDQHLQSANEVKMIDQAFEKIIAIKDSSMDRDFFKEICEKRLPNEIHISVLQGMETHMHVPKGCDGYLVSLINTDPELVARMYRENSEDVHYEILKKVGKYHLDTDDWYIHLKRELANRGSIISEESISK